MFGVIMVVQGVVRVGRRPILGRRPNEGIYIYTITIMTVIMAHVRKILLLYFCLSVHASLNN
jgi:hypothetical protein